MGWQGVVGTTSRVCKQWHAVSTDHALWRCFFRARWGAVPPLITPEASTASADLPPAEVVVKEKRGRSVEWDTLFKTRHQDEAAQSGWWLYID